MSEISIDNFAGGGGVSEGFRRATGREIDIAINHDEIAIRTHTENHPYTKHYCEDVFKVHPKEAAAIIGANLPELIRRAEAV